MQQLLFPSLLVQSSRVNDLSAYIVCYQDQALSSVHRIASHARTSGNRPPPGPKSSSGTGGWPGAGGTWLDSSNFTPNTAWSMMISCLACSKPHTLTHSHSYQVSSDVVDRPAPTRKFHASRRRHRYKMAATYVTKTRRVTQITKEKKETVGTK